MPRHERKVEKAKNFKGSVKRLLKELNPFKRLLVISLVLACLGAILTIVTPNILRDLTDKISDGLVVNKDNLEYLTKEVTGKLNEENIIKATSLNINEDVIKKIMLDERISLDDKNIFNEAIKNKDFSNMPSSILEVLIKDKDVLKFMESINNKVLVIPESVANRLFDEITIDGVNISAVDQAKFLESISTVDDYSNVTKLYKTIDDAPDSIKKIVEPNMDINGIKHIALILVTIYLVSAIFEYIEQITMTDVSNNFARRLRSNISGKINRLPLKYFDKHSIGDTLSRVTNDVDMISQSLNQSLASLVSALTLFVGTVIMMFVTNSIMALTAILSSLFGFIFMAVVLSKSQKYFVEKQKELGNLDGHIEEVYSGLNVVKTYNGQKISNEKFDELNNKLYRANWKSEFLSGLMMPMMGFIGNFGYVAVCVVGALLAINGNISFGVIVAFIVYVRLFVSPLSQIAQAMTSMQSVAAASERVFEFMDEKEMPVEKNMEVLDKDKVKGNIEFKNVVFKYDGNDKPTINGFSAVAKPGQKVAIVGPTGAGKTTMVNLLMKFYDINDGEILIDGVSTKKLTRENVHSLFTMVLQDTWIFNGTIKENIVYNGKGVTDYDVREVCKTVGLDHFIKTLPNGYDTVLSDNDSVSAGQRQLLTIARGMIQDAPFLILDEATSNVDTRTEELVQSAMDKLTIGKTSFIIAHRLSTIKNADLILVMNNGNIIEQGNHEELMKQNGFYAELYNSQFKL